MNHMCGIVGYVGARQAEQVLMEGLRRLEYRGYDSAGVAAVFARYARSAMLETLHQDYVRTARSKGLSEKIVIVGHALRNSLITIVTLVGVYVPILLSASVVIDWR